jgi:hypothetical protein
MPDLIDVRKEIIPVTGASQGVRRQFARVLAARQTAKLGSLGDEIRKAGGRRVIASRSLPLSPCGRGWTRCEALRTGEGYVSADTVGVVRYPSSGASRHLLPQGEKGRTVQITPPASPP